MQNIVPTGKYILSYKKTGYKLDFKNINGLYIQITLYFCFFLSKYPTSILMVSSVEMPLYSCQCYETGVCLWYTDPFPPDDYWLVVEDANIITRTSCFSLIQANQRNTDLESIGLSLDLGGGKAHNPQFTVWDKGIQANTLDLRIGRSTLTETSYFRCPETLLLNTVLDTETFSEIRARQRLHRVLKTLEASQFTEIRVGAGQRWSDKKQSLDRSPILSFYYFFLP